MADPAFMCACSLIVAGVVLWCASWLYVMVYLAAWHSGEAFGPSNVTAGLRIMVGIFSGHAPASGRLPQAATAY